MYSQKKAVSLTFALLIAVLCLSLLPASVLAAEHKSYSTSSSNHTNAAVITGKCGKNVTYTLKDGEMKISGTGPMEDYVFNNHGGTINVPWYEYMSGIWSVVIEPGVTHVGNWSFYQATLLNSVILPDTLVSIGDYSFSGCKKLEAIDLPDSLKSIGSGALAGLGLKQIDLPDSLTTIDTGAFSSNTELKQIDLPETIKDVGREMFYGCSSLESVRLPSNLTRIRYKAFYGCSSLKTIVIPKSVSVIGDYAFKHCTELEPMELPENAIIYKHAFDCCPKFPPVPAVTKQPTFSLTQSGETARFKVEATGKGLIYNWYYMNPGDSNFTKTSKHDSTYMIKMTAARNGRIMYCEVVDYYGRVKRTKTVMMADNAQMNQPVYIIQQPVNIQVSKAGDLATLRIKVVGTNPAFHYHWYYKNPNMDTFQECSSKEPYYSIRVTKARNGRQMYCVVFDNDGNQFIAAKSNTVTLTYKNASPGAVPEDEE